MKLLELTCVVFCICVIIPQNYACPKKAQELFNRLIGLGEEESTCPNVQKKSTYDSYNWYIKSCGLINIKKPAPGGTTAAPKSSVTAAPDATTAPPAIEATTVPAGPLDPTSTIDHFPWEVRIHIKETEEYTHGALINQKYVLTAAHVIAEKKPADLTCVRLGYNSKEQGGNKTYSAGVQSIFIHSNYSAALRQNDIALIKLSVSIWYTSFISPLCLPIQDTPVSGIVPGTKVKVIGTMATDKNPKADNEKLIGVKIIDPEVCKKKWMTNATTKANVDPSQYLCASWPGKTDCRADAGKPLLYQIKESETKYRYIHIGIQSLFSLECETDPKPPIYIKTEAYTDWIISIINNPKDQKEVKEQKEPAAA